MYYLTGFTYFCYDVNIPFSVLKEGYRATTVLPETTQNIQTTDILATTQRIATADDIQTTEYIETTEFAQTTEHFGTTEVINCDPIYVFPSNNATSCYV